MKEILNHKPTVLKLDIDTQDIVALYENELSIQFVVEMLDLTVISRKSYKTAKGWHRCLKIAEELTPLEIVLVQCLMGSDLRRETFNTMRVLKLSDAPPFWQSRWNVLYSEKLPKEKEEC